MIYIVGELQDRIATLQQELDWANWELAVARGEITE